MSEKRVAYQVVNVGDWVRYDTSRLPKTCIVPKEETGFERSQYFRACNTRKWRVYRKTDGQIELVSAVSVGKLWLYGVAGYENVVKTLKRIAQAFVNPNFAENARCLGVCSRSVDTVKLHKGVKKNFPYQDKRGFAEVKELKRKGLLPKLQRRVVIGSRDVEANDQGYALMVRTMTETGAIESETLYYSGLDMEVDSFNELFGVIVFVTLKRDILLADGDGSEMSPYKLTF